MLRPLRWYDYLTINIYWLSLTTLSQTNGLVLPLLVQQFVGPASQGAYYGTLRLWMLMVALLAQSFLGWLSDRSMLRWGRRRPFIFLGTLGDMVFIAGIGFAAGLAGLTGYGWLFVMVLLLQVTTNMAHGAQQGLIPDLVPDKRRGRFSGIKAALELPLPVILVAFTVGQLIKGGNLWGGLAVTMVVLLIGMGLTMLVPEKPLTERPAPADFGPFLRLAAMTGVFALIILGAGYLVNVVGGLLVGVQSTAALLFVMGVAGLAAMVLAVVAGVWSGVRLGLGAVAAKNKSFTWWVINRLAFLVGAINLSTFAVYFLQARLGFAKEKAAGPASTLMMFVGIFILLSALPSGWLADRVGRKPLVAAAGVLGALGALIALSAPSLPVIYFGGCFIGGGTGLFYAANWALGTEIVPKGEAGRYLGISNLAGAGAGAVGAYIGGPIADYFTVHVPGEPGLGYVLLFGIYGVLFLCSILALVNVQEPRVQREA
jgi:MFS family permease